MDSMYVSEKCIDSLSGTVHSQSLWRSPARVRTSSDFDPTHGILELGVSMRQHTFLVAACMTVSACFL